MLIVIQDLKLDDLYVIYPGDKSFAIDEKITAYGLTTFSELQSDPAFKN